MRCDVFQNGAEAMAVLTGHLGVSEAPKLRGHLQGLVSSGARHLTVDLGGVPSVDSAVLGVFVAAHRRVRALDGSIVLVNATEPVRRALRVAGLDRALAPIE